MDITELRGQIDAIEDIARQIAQYKKENGLSVFVPAREREKLADVAQKAGPEMANYTRALYSTLFELSRSYQEACTAGPNEVI